MYNTYKMIRMTINWVDCIIYQRWDFISLLKLSVGITQDDIPEIQRLFILEYEKMYGWK